MRIKDLMFAVLVVSGYSSIFAQSTFDTSKAITSGKASVTIYRVGKLPGAPLEINIYDIKKAIADGKVIVVPDGDNFDVELDSVLLYGVQVATIKNKSYYTAEFDPGEQVFVSRTRNIQAYENKNLIKISLEANKRYFLRTDIAGGGRALIKSVSSETALEEIKPCNLSDEKLPIKYR